jgi:hypothetical protein
MRREDIPKLLGGYATNTLTPEERQALFEAALQDQELFDALAAEEALRETLEDPSARNRIERAIEERPQSWLSRVSAAFRTPRIWALSASLAAAVIIGSVAIQLNRKDAARIETAALKTPAQPPVAAPAVPASPAISPQAYGGSAGEPATVPRETDPRLRKPEPSPARPAAVASLAPLRETECLDKAKKDAGPPPDLAAGGGGYAAAGVPLRTSRAVPPPPPAVQPAPSMVVTSEEDLRRVPRHDENASMARQNQMADRIALPEQKPRQAGKASSAPVMSLGGAALARGAAAAPPPVRYTLLGPGNDAGYVTLEAAADAKPAPGLRVQLEPAQAGYLYALSGEDVLMSVYAVAGGRYVVQPRPQDRELTVILSPVPEPGKGTGSKVLAGALAGKEAKLEESIVRSRSVLRISLPRQR